MITIYARYQAVIGAPDPFLYILPSAYAQTTFPRCLYQVPSCWILLKRNMEGALKAGRSENEVGGTGEGTPFSLFA